MAAYQNIKIKSLLCNSLIHAQHHKKYFFRVEHSLRKEASLLSGATAADTSVSLGRWQQDEARKSVLTSPIALTFGKWYQ